MANTKIPAELSSTPGIIDNSNATAITIDSSENVGIGTSSPSVVLDTRLSTTTGKVAEFHNNAGYGIGFTVADDGGVNTINSESNQALAFATNGASNERVRIDISGRLGIGCTPTDFATEIQANSGGNALKLRGRSAGGNEGWLVWTDNADNVEAAMYATADNLIFANTTSYTERMRIDSSGNVGIGTSSPSNKLVIAEGTNQHGIEFAPGTLSYIQAYDRATSDYGDLKIDAQTIRFGTDNGSERMRLDASGNLLVGTTNLAPYAGSSVGGMVFRADFNLLGLSRNSNYALSVNRYGTDGDIVNLRKDGTTVGSIGTEINSIYLANGDVSLMPYDNGDTILPRNGTGGSRDAAIDLGDANNRFKDIHLRGSVYADLVRGYADTDTYVNFAGENVLSFITGASERMRIDSAGRFVFNKTNPGFEVAGVTITAENNVNITADGEIPLQLNRLTNDGTLVAFSQATSLEGTISVSGSTVSYNGFSGNHETSGISTDTEVGTVCSTIDELDTYVSGTKSGQTRTDHAKIKVSDTVGDTRVYGVLTSYSETDNKPVVASVGIGSIKVTGACSGGDLLESNGDGTAKVQSDDIVRSKTIGKVTIGNSDTGVKLVSCVLYCG